MCLASRDGAWGRKENVYMHAQVSKSVDVSGGDVHKADVCVGCIQQLCKSRWSGLCLPRKYLFNVQTDNRDVREACLLVWELNADYMA